MDSSKNLVSSSRVDDDGGGGGRRRRRAAAAEAGGGGGGGRISPDPKRKEEPRHFLLDTKMNRSTRMRHCVLFKAVFRLSGVSSAIGTMGMTHTRIHFPH